MTSQRFSIAALLVLLLIGVVSLGWWLVLRLGSTPLADGFERSGPGGQSTAALQSEVGSPAGREEPEASTRREVVVSEPAAEAEAADPRLAEVRGRFLLPDGAGAAGVSVRVSRWNTDSRRALKYGVPKNWQGPEAVLTDSDGHFILHFDPPRALLFRLDATLASFGKESWQWKEIEPGQVVDLGVTTLTPSGDVLVSIVDLQGKPVTGVRWTVVGRAIDRGGGPGRADAFVFASSPEADGRYRVAGLSAGLIVLNAQSSMARAQGPRIRVLPGCVVEAEIRYDGPDNSRRILVDASTRPLREISRELEIVRLLKGGVVVAERMVSGPSGDYTFEDLQAGFYTVEIQDQRFEAWSQIDVEPGTRVRARLRGNSAILLSMLDEETGELIEPYALTVRDERPEAWPTVFSVRAPGAAAADEGLYEGMIAVPQTLLLSAPGYADLEVPLPDLAPHETRSIEVCLRPAVEVRGHFTSALDDTPIAGAKVHLLPPGSTPASIMVHRGISARLRNGVFEQLTINPPAVLHEATTDAAGRFRFTSIPSGKYVLIGQVNDWIAASLDPVQVRADESSLELKLRAKDMAGLDGRLLGPAGADYEGMIVIASPTADPIWNPVPSRDGLQTAVDGDGRFRLSNLPPGRLELRLTQGRVVLASGRSFTQLRGFAMELGAVELPSGEVIQHEWQVGEAWPGSLEVIVRADLHPASDIVVELKGEGESRVAAGGVTDSEGVARIARISPGDYVVHLHSAVEHWRWNSGRRVRIESAEPAGLSIDYFLARGTLTFLGGEEGTPFASRRAAVSPLNATPMSSDSLPMTDAEGRLKLTLPLGYYRVSVLDPDGSWTTPLDIEWATDGPVPYQLRFE